MRQCWLALSRLDPVLKKLAPRAHTIPRVLIAPRCHLKAPHHQESYVKADIFYSQRAKEREKISFVKDVLDMPRFTGNKTLMKLGHALLDLHNPRAIDWRAKFGLSPAPPPEQSLTNEFIASIEGLAHCVPERGNDWFVLKAEPSTERLEWIRRIKAAGYQGNKNKKGQWVWSFKS